MKPAPFIYHRPTSLPEALALLAGLPGDVRLLAGGQSLLPMLALRLAQPEQLIDINRVEELKGIRDDGDHVVIGALTRYSEILESALIARELPLLAEAVGHVAHHAIRNRGTIGGSLALADPAAETVATCLALKALIVARSVSEEREIAIDSFLQSLMSTALKDDEILSSIRIPKRRANVPHVFSEFARRRGDFAQAGLIVAPAHAGVPEPRVVVFAAGSMAWRSSTLELAIKLGAGLTTKARGGFAREIADRVDEHALVDYKTCILTTLAERAFMRLAQ